MMIGQPTSPITNKSTACATASDFSRRGTQSPDSKAGSSFLSLIAYLGRWPVAYLPSVGALHEAGRSFGDLACIAYGGWFLGQHGGREGHRSLVTQQETDADTITIFTCGTNE